MATTKTWMHQVSIAACEWFLMFLMFIDAGLAYFATKIAQCCKLQTPCLFCLRLDRLDHESYPNFFCTTHQADLSALVSCTLHNKLAKVREMCDDCFMSITIQSLSNSGCNRVMAGRIRREWHQKSYLNKNFVRVLSSNGVCSCCTRPWKPKLGAQRLAQPSSACPGSTKLSVKPPLPRGSGGRRFTRRDSLKRARDKLMGTMSQVSHMELKCTSDSESEALLSDDEGVSLAVPSVGTKRVSKDDSIVLRSTTEGQNKVKHRRRHSYSASDLTTNLKESAPGRVMSLTSCGSVGQCLGELNWLQTRPISTPPPEPVSLSDLFPSNISNQNKAVESPRRASAQKSSVASTSDQKPSSSHDREQRDPPESEKDKTSSVETDSSTQNRHELLSMDGNQAPQVSVSSDKSNSHGHLDRNNVSEIEGDSLTEKLKQKVEHDKKCLRLLQSELEEERTAAASAAHQAMTLITRLQEEKASLQMDALQYLRMMEEQAEYDMEALEKAHDIIEEKEKEIQDLQSELDFYKSQFDDELGYETKETEKPKGESSENTSNDASSSSESKNTKALEPHDEHNDVHGNVQGLITEIEDEKRYISQRLSEIERKMNQFSTHEKSKEVKAQENENESEVDASKKRVCGNGGEGDLSALENEISDLNERLEALEADRDFLEHVCNTVQTTGGLQFIQEIAHHLKDMRKILHDK